MLCSKCGKLNPEGTKFCAYCGNEMTERVNTGLKCPKCGSNNDADSRFCLSCGFPLGKENSGTSSKTATSDKRETWAQQQAPNIIINQSNQIPPEYKPISMWGYFGYTILFAIPILGLILTIVFSFNSNINLRNYARSHFCILIILVVLVFILGMTGLSLGAFSNYYY